MQRQLHKVFLFQIWINYSYLTNKNKAREFEWWIWNWGEGQDLTSLCEQNSNFLLVYPIIPSNVIIKGYTNPKCQVTMATKFWTVVCNICGSSVWNLFMSPFWYLEFWGSYWIPGRFVHPWIKHNFIGSTWYCQHWFRKLFCSQAFIFCTKTALQLSV